MQWHFDLQGDDECYGLGWRGIQYNSDLEDQLRAGQFLRGRIYIEPQVRVACERFGKRCGCARDKLHGDWHGEPERHSRQHMEASCGEELEFVHGRFRDCLCSGSDERS